MEERMSATGKRRDRKGVKKKTKNKKKTEYRRRMDDITHYKEHENK